MTEQILTKFKVKQLKTRQKYENIIHEINEFNAGQIDKLQAQLGDLQTQIGQLEHSKQVLTEQLQEKEFESQEATSELVTVKEKLKQCEKMHREEISKAQLTSQNELKQAQKSHKELHRDALKQCLKTHYDELKDVKKTYQQAIDKLQSRANKLQ